MGLDGLRWLWFMGKARVVFEAGVKTELRQPKKLGLYGVILVRKIYMFPDYDGQDLVVNTQS